jgi:membrane protease YdiL (CAAX protease family)
VNDAHPGQEPPAVPRLPTPPGRVRWWIHLTLIGAYPVVLGTIGLDRQALRGPALTHTSKGLLITCGVELAFFFCVIGCAWLASRATREDLLLRWRGGIWTVPLGVGYSVALRLALGFIAVVLFATLVLTKTVNPDQIQEFTRANRPDVSSLVDLPALRNDPLYFWLTVTLVSFVVAGLREELWRSAFIAALRSLWPVAFGSRPRQIAAVGVASIVFGLGHLSLGLVGVVAATLLGFGLGVIMVLHRSIWPAVIAHGMFDATTFGLLPWAMEQLKAN